MNLKTLRQGVAARAKTATARSYAYMPDELVIPCAVVAPAAGDVTVSYPETINRGKAVVTLRVVLFASRANDKAGQEQIDTWLSTGAGLTATSVVEALHDTTISIGGGAETLVVVSAGDYGSWADSKGVEYYKADVVVRLTASRV